MKSYRKTVKIPEKLAQKIEKYLNLPYGLKESRYQHEDDTITVTVRFPDSTEMDIKCCGSQDGPSYTEAVLFKNGTELASSGVSEDFLGEWTLETEARCYTVVIELIPKENEERTAPRSGFCLKKGRNEGRRL